MTNSENVIFSPSVIDILGKILKNPQDNYQKLLSIETKKINENILRKVATQEIIAAFTTRFVYFTDINNAINNSLGDIGYITNSSHNKKMV